MKETRFKRQFQKDYLGEPAHIEYGPSVTVPDLGLTVRQLMSNHTRGIGGVESRPTFYSGDETVPPGDDLVDLMEHREQLELRKEELEAQVKAEKQAAKEKREKEKPTPPTPPEPPTT